MFGHMRDPQDGRLGEVSSQNLHADRQTFFVLPTGMEIPGMPAKSAVTVKMSAKYIANGSSVFSPSLNAGVGVVGVTIASTLANASSKSRASKLRPVCAFR